MKEDTFLHLKGKLLL